MHGLLDFDGLCLLLGLLGLGNGHGQETVLAGRADCAVVNSLRQLNLALEAAVAALDAMPLLVLVGFVLLLLVLSGNGEKVVLVVNLQRVSPNSESHTHKTNTTSKPRT
jgi:hypothetical protein